MADNIVVLSWRVTPAEPSGFTMWFDPAAGEEPRLVRHPPDSEFFEGAGAPEPLESPQVDWILELHEGGGVGTHEGGDADDGTTPELLIENEPPPGWLSTLWEGGPDGTT